MEEFTGDVSGVIARAKEAGVLKMINVGLDVLSSRRSIDLARMHPAIFAAVGIHPHSANDLNIETFSQLLTLASSHKKVVAVGEIGLDYYYLKRSSQYSNCPSREHQMLAFEQMLDLALELKLPVIIHCREAEADLLAVLKTYADSLTGVVHCFSSNLDFAEEILGLGFAISFTGNITFKNAGDLRAVVKRIPLGSLMVETDAPLMTPEPYRGKRNEPAFVVEVAKKIAEIKEISLLEVERNTTKKAEKLFGI
jgi:TatD DNase family protein